MAHDLSPIETAKFVAARHAAGMVESGMRVGLGTGSTADWMLRCLAERVHTEGLRVIGVPTSRRTADLAADLGIPLATLDEVKWLNLTIDGADEFDADLNLIKGGGAALLREKIVATEMLVGMDVLGHDCRLRLAGDGPLLTDESNYIIDLHLNRIGNARHLAMLLNQIPGVVENGLFIDICDTVIIGHADGRVIVRDRTGATQAEDRSDLPDLSNIFADTGD